MRRITTYLALLIAVIFMAPKLLSQTHLTKYSGNPILDAGSSGSWNSWSVAYPWVIYDGTIYKMWYIGTDGVSQAIGFATSQDGLNWTKYSGNPVLEGTPGSWDSAGLGKPCVLYVNGQYMMWYTGSDGSNNQIGFATSTNGIDWEKYSGNPVLIIGSSGSWDAKHAYRPSVIYDGNIFRMWYEGLDKPVGGTYRIGYATSTDGMNWQKHPSNPVLDIGLGGTWEDGSVGAPSVVWDGSQYVMFYQGSGHWLSPGWQIGVAFSNDGIHWEKSAINPVIPHGNPGEWDDAHVGLPCALLQGATYKVWYGGNRDGTHTKIGYAEGEKEAIPELPFSEPVGPMLHHRFQHTATLLRDGCVLITGGVNGSGVTLSSAEIFNPISNTFEQTGNMMEARTRHSAVLLQDGRVLIVGGSSSNNYPLEVNKASCEIFDPATGSFTYTGSLNTGRHSAMVALLADGRVLVAGGGVDNPGNGSTALASCEIYDPNTGTFSQITPMQEPRMYTQIVPLLSGELLVAGGTRGDGNFGASTAYSSIEIFNLATLSWSLLPVYLLTARSKFGASLLPSGSVLFTGGQASTITGGTGYSSTEILTPPASINYSVKLRHSRSFHTQTPLPDGHIFVAGGILGPVGSQQQLADAELIDLVENTTTALMMKTPRVHHTATLLQNDNILLVGGSTSVDAEIFRFTLDSPPIADAGPDQTVEATSPAGTEVTLDGSGSSDPDGDPLTYRWYENGELIAKGVQPTVLLGLGEHHITLIVNDGQVDSEPDEVVIWVVDTTPPEINVSATPEVLWPPNHKLVEVHFDVVVSDVVDPEPSVVLISVTSNEADNRRGDGHTTDDIQGADLGTPDFDILLRAERSGRGQGREYSVVYSATDFSGNVAYDTAVVRVPKKLGKELAELPQKSLPDDFVLSANYPNPFNPETVIRYGLPAASEVKLRILDATGRLVRVLVKGLQQPGYHEAVWDGRDALGRSVSSGVYFYFLQAGSFTQSRKMILLR